MSMKLSNKKGAMEMSVGTIVTIVLLMSVLVLGIFLVQEIFSTSTNAIDQVDSQVQDQINKLFSSGDKDVAILPPSQKVSVQKGQTPPAGFAFSIKNPTNEKGKFNYETKVQSLGKCKEAGLTKSQIEGWMLGASGSLSLGPSQKMDKPFKVTFSVPENAPECTFLVVHQVNSEVMSQSKNSQVRISITSGGIF